MSVENIKQGSIIADKISLLLRNGENDKVLDLLEQNYGALARGAMEKVMKYSNLSQDEMVRVFGKISDILENVADKISQNERLNAKKEKDAAAKEQAEDEAEFAAAQAEATERQKQFEDRIRYVEEQKQKLAEERRRLEKQRRIEKDARKRHEIEEKLKRLDERKKHLETERQKLERMKEENRNAVCNRTNGDMTRESTEISSSIPVSENRGFSSAADMLSHTTDSMSSADTTFHTKDNANLSNTANDTSIRVSDGSQNSSAPDKTIKTTVFLKSRAGNDRV